MTPGIDVAMEIADGVRPVVGLQQLSAALRVLAREVRVLRGRLGCSLCADGVKHAHDLRNGGAMSASFQCPVCASELRIKHARGLPQPAQYNPDGSWTVQQLTAAVADVQQPQDAQESHEPRGPAEK